MDMRLGTGVLDINITVHNRGDHLCPSVRAHPCFNVGDLARTRLVGLAERCLNHLAMADADTADQLPTVDQGVDFLTRPASSVTLIDDSTERTCSCSTSHRWT